MNANDIPEWAWKRVREMVPEARLAVMEREGLPMELLPEDERVVAARAAA